MVVADSQDQVFAGLAVEFCSENVSSTQLIGEARHLHLNSSREVCTANAAGFFAYTSMIFWRPYLGCIIACGDRRDLRQIILSRISLLFQSDGCLREASHGRGRFFFS